MPVSKLKNLAILILLLANLALVLLVVPGRIATQQESDALRDSLCSLYGQQEITLSPEVIPDTVSLYVLEMKEMPEGSRQAAAVLLGDALQTEADSTRYYSNYRSDLGTCSISLDGEFSAVLTGQKERSDLEADCRRLLKAMGFSYDSKPSAQRIRAGVYQVTATQQVLGVPVFSGDLVLTYSNNRLTAIDGIFLSGTSSLTRVSDNACLSAADALVAFLSARYDLGWVGSAVTGLQQGYIRSETAAAVRLTPVWQLTTDTGVFQINGMTGEVTTLS